MAYIDGKITTKRIPEKGALKVYRKNIKILSLLSLIVGICGIIAYIALSTFVHGGDGAFNWPDLFLIFAVPLAIGLVFCISFYRLERREKAEDGQSECEFYSDCFVYRRKTVSGEVEHRHGYADAVFKGEKGEYAYVFSSGKGEFSLFYTGDLTQEERKTIINLLTHTATDGMQELKKYNEET